MEAPYIAISRFSAEFVPRKRGAFLAFARYVLIGVGYFIAAKFGYAIYFGLHTSPAVIWPPVGYALVVVMLCGYRMWLPIFLGHLAACLTQPQLGFSLVSLISAIAQTVQPLFMVAVMRSVGFQPDLNKVRNVFILIAASLSLTLTAPVISSSLQLLIGATSVDNAILSITRSWAGGIFSSIVVVPVVLSWMWRLRNDYPPRVIFELSSALFLLCLGDLLIFWTEFPQFLGIAVIFVLPAILIWFALRFSPRWTTLALFLSSAIGLAGTIIANPSNGPLNQLLLTDEIYIGMVAAIFYVFVAVVEERRAASIALEKNNRDLQRALDKASREDEAKTEFLAILAHELRNPLAPVISSLELLRLKIEESGQTQLLEPLSIAQDHNRIITQLLDDLLDISRITRKKFRLQLAPVELQKLVRGAARTVDSFYRSRNHTLTVTVPKDAISFEGDELRLMQIMVNLLYNAAKYTNPGGRVALTATLEKGSLLKISVKDNGIGIPREMMEQIFEPFVQGPKRVEKVGTGLGIGLALTKRLVDLHKGTIQVESEGEGKGSEFIVQIPIEVIKQLPLAEREHKPAPAAARGTGKRVLVVDDNEAAARGLSLLLTHFGHTVSIVHDGAAALASIERNAPEVVLLDIGLPDMDGYAVARKVRETESGKHIFLIALTGYGLQEDKIKAQAAGFDRHLTKPVSIAEVERVMAEASTKAAL
ncbi:MAG TPA: ATP-binding protein [Candidatus Paceibacterota bacterium]|nr:ATP-binding protein [Candidatus Paceibacterota bacterium]